MKLNVRALLGRAKGVFKMSKKLATVISPLLLLAQHSQAEDMRNFITHINNPAGKDLSVGLNLNAEFNLLRNVKVFGQAGIHNKFVNSERVLTEAYTEDCGKRWVQGINAAFNRATLRGGVEIGTDRFSVVGEAGIMRPINSFEPVEHTQAFAGLKMGHNFENVGSNGRQLSAHASLGAFVDDRSAFIRAWPDYRFDDRRAGPEWRVGTEIKFNDNLSLTGRLRGQHDIHRHRKFQKIIDRNVNAGLPEMGYTFCTPRHEIHLEFGLLWKLNPNMINRERAPRERMPKMREGRHVRQRYFDPGHCPAHQRRTFEPPVRNFNSPSNVNQGRR